MYFLKKSFYLYKALIKLLILIAIILLSSINAYTLSIISPKNNSNDNSLRLPIELQGGYHTYKIMVDKVYSMNSKDLIMKFSNSNIDTVSVGSYSTTYYIKAVGYTKDFKDSNQSSVYTVRTKKPFTFAIGGASQMYSNILVNDNDGVKLELKLDTTYYYNSKFAKTYTLTTTANKDYLEIDYPINDRKYYYRYRIITITDTTQWYGNYSFNQKASFGIRISNPQCHNKDSLSRLINLWSNPFKGQFTAEFEIKDSNNNLLKKLKYSDGEPEPKYVSDTCQFLWVYGKVYNATDTLFNSNVVSCRWGYNFKTTVNQIGYNIDTFDFLFDACYDSLVVEFSSFSNYQDSTERYNYPIKPGQHELNLKLKPKGWALKYYWRYRFWNQGVAENWTNKGAYTPHNLSFQYRNDSSSLYVQHLSLTKSINRLHYDSLSNETELILQLSEDRNFMDVDSIVEFVFDSTITKGYKILVPSLFKNKFYIRFRHKKKDEYSVWSNVISKAGVRKPNLNAPTNAEFPNFYISSNTYTYNINKDTIKFEYQFGKNTQFLSPLTIISSSGFLNASHVDVGNYKVRVRCYHKLDTSDWSNIATVNIFNSKNLLLNPHLIYPIDGFNINPNDSITFTWAPRRQDNANSYMLIIYENEPNGIIKAFFEIEDTTYTLINFLQNKTKYYWTVYSMNEEIEDRNYPEYRILNNRKVLNNQELSKNKLNIFPNPSNGEQVTFIAETIISEVIIVSMDGSVVQRVQNMNKKKVNLQLKHTSSGIYIAKVKTNNGIIHQKISIVK